MITQVVQKDFDGEDNILTDLKREDLRVYISKGSKLWDKVAVYAILNGLDLKQAVAEMIEEHYYASAAKAPAVYLAGERGLPK